MKFWNFYISFALKWVFLKRILKWLIRLEAVGRHLESRGNVKILILSSLKDFQVFSSQKMWGQISFRQTSNCLTENICTKTVQNSKFCLIVSAEVISGDEKIRDQWTKTNWSQTRQNGISDRASTSKNQTSDWFGPESRPVSTQNGSSPPAISLSKSTQFHICHHLTLFLILKLKF